LLEVSERCSIISQVYIEFRVLRSELIEKGHSDWEGGQGIDQAYLESDGKTTVR
jgi:hypothetical protein